MSLASRLASCLFVLALSAFSPAPALSEDGAPKESTTERLEKEMEGLKKENEDIKKRLEAMEAEDEEIKHGLGALSSLVEVSGYADAEFYLTDKEGDNNRFRVRHLSLFFTKEIQREWKLFTEIEYEDAPFIESTHTTDDPDSVQGKLFVEQMYIEYHPTVAWDLRFGRFLTPAGIWNIFHYPPYVPTQERPLMVRKIFPQVSDGAQLRVSGQVMGAPFDAHLYVANGSGNPGRLDRNEDKGAGLRANVDIGGVSAGASYYREKDNADITRNALGAHLLWNYSPFKAQAEYQYRKNDPDSGTGFIDRGFYLQLTYDIGRWTLAGRYDWYDPNGGADAADIFRYTGAVNYHFAHNVVGKAEYNRNDFEDGTKDYNEVIMAIVVAIGDL